MDQKELEQKIKDAFLRLPSDLQEIVGSGKWVDTIQAIAKKNELSIPQMGQIQTEVMLVLLGIIHADTYLWDIKDSLNLSNEKIEKLIKETSEQIFLPIREKVMSVYERNISEDEKGTVAEKAIFDKAGISIENGATSSGATSSVKTPENRADILKGIENPTKGQSSMSGDSGLKSAIREMNVPVAPYANKPSTNTAPQASGMGNDILAGKLTGMVTAVKKETDYSVGGINKMPPPSTQLGKDSYREPIE